MTLPDVVGNITQNYIGRFLQKVEEESETHSQRDLMMDLGNIAEDLKLQDYKRCLEQCAASNCTQCRTANDWEEDPKVRRQQPQRPRPCTSTQALTSLQEKTYTNAHATCYKPYIALSKEIPPKSPLTYCPESPTFIRLMGVKLP